MSAPNAPRFFVDVPIDGATTLALPDSITHHALHVLRLKPGAPIVVFNNRGGEYAATLDVRGKSATAVIDAHRSIERESPLAISLVQAWIASEKLEWVVEKSVELGVRSIVLAPARRSVARPNGDRRRRRIDRLRELVVAACCQCGRNRLPGLSAADDLDSALRTAKPDAGDAIVLDPAARMPLLGVAGVASSVTLVVGPEGGFDEDELALATRIGYAGRQLGPRILRTETAGVAAIATLQAVAGDFCTPRTL